MDCAVSVLIPTYNTAHLLPETLDSILSQSYPPHEVIVVDDGSTDNTQEVLARYGNRISFHRVENGGVCRARNIAARLATAPFLAFCDSDDLWLNDKLAQQTSLHRDHPEVDYSFTNFRLIIDGVEEPGTKFDQAPVGLFPWKPGEMQPTVYDRPLYDEVLAFQPIWPSTILLKRTFFDSLGGFREELGRVPSEDLEFTLRCVARGPIGILPSPLVRVRKHGANFSRNLEANAQGEIEIMRYALQHHDVTQPTRALLSHQIELRHVELSYGAFQRGDFSAVVSHLSGLQTVPLNSRTRLKLMISCLPRPLARTLQSFLTR